MAAVTTDRVVQLFDDDGERRDKFSTKPASPEGRKNFVVRGMAFSPDSAKLAIAQSDNIVFVYKLGANWGDKKSICNKFLTHHPVAALTWPRDRANELVFALHDGKVKVGQLKTNKAQTLYAHPNQSPAVSLCASPDGRRVCSGHEDGAVYTFDFDTGANAVLCRHSAPPLALSWGAGAVVAAGADRRVVFYDERGEGGRTPKAFDFSSGDPDEREFCVAAFNPAGECAAVGSFDRVRCFSKNASRGTWEDAGEKRVENFYAVTALAWKSDGSKLSVGNLTGVVDTYDACVRRRTYKNQFEFTHASASVVVVKRLSTNRRVAMRAKDGSEVRDVRVRNDRYVVANTAGGSLLVGDLDACKMSEVAWNFTGRETFDFDVEKACVVRNAGEISVVEYGVDEVIGTVRTPHAAQHLVSVRVRDRRGRDPDERGACRRKIAYLVDLRTIRVADLAGSSSGSSSGTSSGTGDHITIQHGSKIDWLELNARATHLLFRDKKRQLHLHDVASAGSALATSSSSPKVTLSPYASYAQWVPNSDVVVAQNRQNLCVWYSLESPDRVVTVAIKGEVEDIERVGGKTSVVVDEGGEKKTRYALDESLIEFNALLEEGAYDAAVDVLEPLELTPETEAMWLELGAAALADKRLLVAQRCSAAVGDVAKAAFLSEAVEDAAEAARGEGLGPGALSTSCVAAEAKLAMLERRFDVAERILVERGQTDQAVAMHREMHRLDLAVQVAEANGNENAANLKREHLEWLKKTGQEEAAGAAKEREGDHLGAIKFYLKGGLPGRAAKVVIERETLAGVGAGSRFDRGLIEEICQALKKADMHERAGELYDALERVDEAKEAYARGHAYRRAIELCRSSANGDAHKASEIRDLEERWGDRLVELKQPESAIGHFAEAGAFMKAAEAAMEARNWKRVLEIVERCAGDERFGVFYRRVARHYERAGDHAQAERCFLRAGEPEQAVEMHCRADRWEAARKVAAGYLSPEAANALYAKRARELEARGDLAQAEKFFLQAKAPDLAIDAYRRARKFDQMIRLVQQHRPERLDETRLLLAKQCEGDGNYREAERRFVEAGDWKSAVKMYRAQSMWEDAVRVAKAGGGGTASKQVAYAWASALGGEAGAALLKKFNLVDGAVDHACEQGAFAHAFDVAKFSGAKHKIPDVEYKYAMFLEDEGKFDDAEEHFVKADKPREAVDMWLHAKEWAKAMRVAETNDPTAVADVLAAQAKAAVEDGEHKDAEASFLKAKRPEAAVDMYRAAGMWDDAVRVCADYLPHRTREIELEAKRAREKGGSGTAGGNPGGEHSVDALLREAESLETAGDYSGAVDAFLEIGAKTTKDQNALERAWNAAVRVAVQNVPGKARAVVAEVAKRMRSIGNQRAADALLEYHGVDESESGYAPSQRGGAKGGGGGAQPPGGFKTPPSGDALDAFGHKGGSSADGGGSAADVEAAARRGDWEEAHRLAKALGPKVAAEYSVKRANMELRGGNPEAAAAALDEHGAPADARYFPLYKEVAREVLAGAQDGYGEKELMRVLQGLTSQMAATPEMFEAADLAAFRRYLEACHLALVRAEAREANLLDLSAKAATSLLRYVGTIPADRAFFEAGIACRECGDRANDAFVFLNRYLDLTELMDDDPRGDPRDLDDDEFETTDVPKDFELPVEHFVKEATREEVRDWVLALSMDQAVDQTLSTRECGGCGGKTYVAALRCHRCGSQSEACVVTGYPVPQTERVAHEGRPARRDDWNRWTNAFGTDPWSGQHATPKY